MDNTLHIYFIVITILIYILYTQFNIKSLLNRPIWYSPPKIWTNNAGGQTLKLNDDSSQQLFDLYSLTHISHGIIFYNLFHNVLHLNRHKAIMWSLIVEIVWELIENTEYIIQKYRRTAVSRHYPGDSWINSVGDVWATLIGISIATTITSSIAQTIIVIGL